MFRIDRKLPIAKEGFAIILKLVSFGLVLALFPYWVCKFFSALTFVLAIFSLYFFRDPRRNALHGSADASASILSPGDGRVLEVSEEWSPILGEKTKVIKIFLSIFDVHLQRAPIPGKIEKIEYQKGKFLDARHPRASFENERNSILIKNGKCKVVVKQIAGWIARRIVCYIQEGEEIGLGQRLGIIQFGSQVDLFLPMDIEVLVKKGEVVKGGVSVVAIQKETREKS